MSCNGCRALRRGCGRNCVLRPCLEWIPSPEAQTNATLFLSNFFGRTDLLRTISATPSVHQRIGLFKSLLYEAAGRKLNPVNGATGFLFTGDWNRLEEAVQTVFAGGSLDPPGEENWFRVVDESSDGFRSTDAWATMMIMTMNQTDAGDLNPAVPNDGEEEQPKLLNLFK